MIFPLRVRGIPRGQGLVKGVFPDINQVEFSLPASVFLPWQDLAIAGRVNIPVPDGEELAESICGPLTLTHF